MPKRNVLVTSLLATALHGVATLHSMMVLVLVLT